MPRFFKSPAVQYLGLFALLAITLFSVLATPWAERLFVQPFTQLLVDICALVLAPFDGRVQAQGDILRFSDGHGAVQVLAGCNAVEVCALLIAAILAFPGRLRDGLIGAAVGVIALQLSTCCGSSAFCICRVALNRCSSSSTTTSGTR